MPIYKKDPPDVGEVVNRMVEKYHGGLFDADVKIDILGAWAATDMNGDTEAVALKLHGYPAQATIAVVSYKNRVLGGGDALLTVDVENWEELSADERDALIDHELEHLQLKTDKDGLLMRDDLERPKIQIRRHDHSFGWFDSVARRHGAASIEIKQLREFNDQHEQLWLPFESECEAVADARNNRKFKMPTTAAEADADRPLLSDQPDELVDIHPKSEKTVKKRAAVKGKRRTAGV